MVEVARALREDETLVVVDFEGKVVTDGDEDTDVDGVKDVEVHALLEAETVRVVTGDFEAELVTESVVDAESELVTDVEADDAGVLELDIDGCIVPVTETVSLGDDDEDGVFVSVFVETKLIETAPVWVSEGEGKAV